MPLVYQQNINAVTKIGVWHIAEAEAFFAGMPLQKTITHPHKRLQHLAGRFLLKELYPDFPLDLIKIADTRKPFLENETYHFSISHCRDYAAVLISKEKRVGVDIELVNDKIERILHKFLTDEECLLMPRGAIQKTATLFWSVKETVYKWQGTGGTDFKEHIRIEKFTGDAEEGIVYCLFKNKIPLQVHYLFFNGNFLTWVLSDH
ncbi:4'-phosphopantetheinyl transferase family protein [Ferruginibacter profundus]